MNLSRWMRIAAPVLASIAGLAMLRLLGPDLLDQETLRRWLAPLGGWTPVAFVALLALRPLTLLPGQPFTALGGILFGALIARGSAYARPDGRAPSNASTASWILRARASTSDGSAIFAPSRVT